MNNKPQKERLVYSTDTGELCPECNQAKLSCNCKTTSKERVLGNGKVIISRSTKGRKGKGVTLISGLPLNTVQLETLGKELRKKCSTGGTVKNGIIEIQGDQRDVLLKELQKQGYSPKVSGK